MEVREAGSGGRAGSSADSLAEEEEEDEEEGPGSGRCSRTSSLVSGLLTELYSAAEAAAPSGSAHARVLRELQQQRRPSQVRYLRLKDVNELTTIKRELNYRISVQSAKLLRLLKQKDRLVHEVQKNCDIVTACLQAVSQKRHPRSPGGEPGPPTRPARPCPPPRRPEGHPSATAGSEAPAGRRAGAAMRQDKLTSSLRRGGRCLKRQSSGGGGGGGGGVGTILSNVLKKRSCISRTAPRLLCTLEPDPASVPKSFKEQVVSQQRVLAPGKQALSNTDGSS